MFYENLTKTVNYKKPGHNRKTGLLSLLRWRLKYYLEWEDAEDGSGMDEGTLFCGRVRGIQEQSGQQRQAMARTERPMKAAR